MDILQKTGCINECGYAGNAPSKLVKKLKNDRR